MKLPVWFTKHAPAIGLMLFTGLSLPISIASQPGFSSIAQAPPDLGAPRRSGGGGTHFSPPPPPPGDAPGRPRGGAARGQCPAVTTPLTALVPATEKTVTQANGTSTVTTVWGQTTVAQPVLWFYVPYSQKSGFPVEFVLQNREGTTLYKAMIALPEKPGILAVRLPNTIAPLEPEKLYQWYFKVYCNQRSTPPVFVKGWIQRISLTPSLQQQLEAASQPERAAIYAKSGIWYDALTTLGDLRFANPNNSLLTQEWTSLLESVKLSDVAAQPLVK